MSRQGVSATIVKDGQGLDRWRRWGVLRLGNVASILQAREGVERWIGGMTCGMSSVFVEVRQGTRCDEPRGWCW
jgi:hypothetical protein